VSNRHLSVRWFSDKVDSTQQQSKQQEPQPHGTATITFTEQDDINNNDDDDTNKHPIESLQGGGDPSQYTVPIVIQMPDMSDEDDIHNTIEKWYKQPGDVIKRNDILCDIATPDFTFGMVTEDEEDAVMGEIHVPEGTMVPDHTPICTIYHRPADQTENKTTDE
jgi:hypothetical protein